MPKQGARGSGFSTSKGTKSQAPSTVPHGGSLSAALWTRSNGPEAFSARPAGKRERASQPHTRAALGDVLSAAMEQSVLRKQQSEAAAATRAARSAQRTSSPEPPLRTAAMKVSPTGGSGTSGTPQG